MKSLDKPIATGRTAEVFAWDEDTVLKLYYDWCPAHWADQELRTARLVHQAGVPSPAILDMVTVAGRQGLVYERVVGPSMLDAIIKNPLNLIKYARMMACLQVKMHRCSGDELASQRSSVIWAINHASELPEDRRQAILEKLEVLPDGDRLCHGDFHPSNIIVTSQGPLVIDWMTAVRGSPAADIARTYLLLSQGDAPSGGFMLQLVLLLRKVLVREYLNAYASQQTEYVNQFKAWLPVMAAARLNENIASEKDKLLKFIQ
jgi:uncharacterized protein (TIGR02172 family)